MDKSKMAKAGTAIEYDLFKGDYGMDGMSRPVKQHCGIYCYDPDCKCKKGLEEILNPKDDDCCAIPVRSCH